MTQFDTFLHQSIATLQLQCISILHNVWFPVLLQVLDFPPFISDILPTADGTTTHVIGYNPQARYKRQRILSFMVNISKECWMLGEVLHLSSSPINSSGSSFSQIWRRNCTGGRGNFTKEHINNLKRLILHLFFVLNIDMVYLQLKHGRV